MSSVCNRSSLQQECNPGIPAEEPLTGDETLDDFVQKVRLREKSRPKRDQLPDLAPSAEIDKSPSNFWQQARDALVRIVTDDSVSHRTPVYCAYRQ